MDEVNKNIPLNTPCPSFFPEEKQEEDTAVEALVNLSSSSFTSRQISSKEEEEEEEEICVNYEEDAFSENENESTTTPSPIPIALPEQPNHEADQANSLLNTTVSNFPSTPVLQQQLDATQNENNNLFLQQMNFPTSIFPPSQDIEEILGNSEPVMQPYIAKKGGKMLISCVNYMRMKMQH